MAKPTVSSDREIGADAKLEIRASLALQKRRAGAASPFAAPPPGLLYY